MTDAATTGNASGNNAAAGAGDTATWYAGFDDETKGYVQNKGLATKSLNEAFMQVSKFHREAEKMIGAPANELIRLPKEANAPEWDGVYKRLGALDAPEKYDFAGVKRAGGKDLEPALLDTLRKAAHVSRLTPDAANKVASEVIKHLDGTDAAEMAKKADALATEQKTLNTNWGTKFTANKLIAGNAATALGITPEEVTALEGVVGYAKVMEMFRQIGAKIGEDRFVTPPGGGGNGVMTRDQAVEEKANVMRDQAWVKRYLDGGLEEKRKMDALNRLIVGI